MMKAVTGISASLLCLATFLPLAVAQEDVRGVSLRQQGLKVIEEKCLVCHNRQRIDAAIRERRDMEKILQKMEKRGVALTEKDRSVLGHFAKQSPFKEKGEAARKPQEAPVFSK